MTEKAPINYAWRAIRIAEVRANGFVAFDFHVGDPDIYAEMLLPVEAFRAFCTTQGVEPIGPGVQIVSTDGLGFSLRDAAAHAANSGSARNNSVTNPGIHHAA